MEYLELEDLLPFYRFIYSRQLIWHKRYIEKLPAPWTEDAVLKSYKFCNVYRQLDKGTQSITTLLENQGTSPLYKLFNIIAYRFFNRAETVDVLFKGGLNPDSFDVEALIKHFDACHKQGPIFNDAYVISPQVYKVGVRERDKHVQILYMLDDLRKELPSIYERLQMGEGLPVFNEIPMVGTFLAGQMLLDCTYSTNKDGKQDLTPLTANDFLIVGPGAKWGLDILWGEKLSKENADKACRYLHAQQHKAFKKLKEEGMDFSKIAWQNATYPEKGGLALHDIQNSLCEFRKYHRLTHDGQGRRRLFKGG